MPNSRPTFHNIGFLVIDRDATVLKSAENYLRLNGAPTVHAVETVLLAMDILKDIHARTDCIICAQDVTPILGLEFLKSLRCGKYAGAHTLRGTNFIMLTAHREKTLVQAAVDLDINGYITKPFDQASFTRGVQSGLAHHIDLKPATAHLHVDIRNANRLPVWLSPA